MAHAQGVPVLVDGAQGVPHLPVDVQALGCDFYAFSGHKVFGPSGIGALWGRASLLESMPPWQGGGDMILSVTFEKTTYNVIPYKFEAGTPNIAGTIALGAALDYLAGIGMERIAAHEHELLAYAHDALREVPGLRFIGTAPREGRRPLVRAGGRPSARHGHRARLRGHRHPHRPSLRAAGDGALRGARDGARVARRSTTRGTRWTRWCAGCTRSGRCSHERRSCASCTRKSSSTTRKKPRNFRADAGGARTAEGFNPLCGDRATVFVERRRRRA